ncbi:MAG: cobyric acid synthase [Oribacterium sp.]|nr:cobyric acid synthase [Oribacterium sp.]
MTNAKHPAHRARAIMVQGTMSNAGKSLLVAGLCRIFHEDGYRVAPFKAQNMALNSFITDEGLEMGRAQVVQAEAAGIAPDARMNPILLKPTTDVGSQVIVRGVAQGNMTAREYYLNKRALLPVVRETYEALAAEYDIIVIEGAGSPAEVNLREDDLVNMGMAAIADAPVLLVGDIDRGGVFAQLLGTIELLEPEERARIQGLIINKFRGDKTILDPGLDILEARTGKAVLGVVPYLDVVLEDEDSLSTALEQRQAEGGLDIAVIRLPRISNFTDFTALATEPCVSVRYVSSVRELGEPDVLILPGTKSTIRDLDWLRSTGLEAKILQKQARGTLILGICGGFQMLGTEVVDVEGVEGPAGARTRGLGLLPLRTEFEAEKTRTQTRLVLEGLTGEFAALNGQRVDGYEIHMGRTMPDRHPTDAEPRGDAPATGQGDAMATAGSASSHAADSCFYAQAGNVFGTYLHGFFDRDGLRNAFVERLCRRKGIDPGDRKVVNYEAFKEAQFAKLSAALRASLDMARIYEILEGEQV